MELIEQYKTLTAELTRLDVESERVRAQREEICKQLLQQHPKGHAFDLGDGQLVVVAKAKGGTHYMAPKNKWVRSGRPPKPPKEEKAPRVKAPKAPKPLVKRAIVNGQVVETPIERRPSSVPPPSAGVSPAPKPEIPSVSKAPEPGVKAAVPVEPEEILDVGLDDLEDGPVEAISAEEPQATPAEPPAPTAEVDELEAALAELGL